MPENAEKEEIDPQEENLDLAILTSPIIENVNPTSTRSKVLLIHSAAREVSTINTRNPICIIISNELKILPLISSAITSWTSV